MSLPPMLSNFPPSPPSVTVIFRGLLTFCFDGGNACEVGVVNDFETGQEHELVFRKWVRSTLPRCPPGSTLYPKPTNSFELRINNPLPSVNEVYIIGKDPFNRLSAATHSNDFRWMIDFESELYGDFSVPVGKIPAKVKPRLTINKGIFYTHHKTLTKFNAVPADGKGTIHLGGSSIAEVMAARIYLDVGGSVDVIIDDTQVDTLSQTSGTEYQLDVFNLCNDADCDYLPAHPTDEKKRNDFHTYYRVISLSTGMDVHHLMAVLPIPGQPNPIIDICSPPPETGSDPAPCGCAGFGKSQTFD